MTRVTEILNFVLKYSHYSKNLRAEIRKTIELHLSYRTCMIIRDSQERIVAIVRWNFLSPITVLVLDIVIHPDYKRKNMLRRMLLLGIQRNPQVKWLCFTRGTKYPERKLRYYSVEEFLGTRKHKGKPVEKELINV